MLYLLDDTPPELPFPHPEEAETEPNGLLAVGGDLTPRRLIEAYKTGIFPWFSEDQPILWWSPDPRMILRPDELKISRSLRKTLRRGRFQVSMNQAFEQVIRGCAAPRADDEGTWLLPQMIEAYGALHRRGVAHSVEVWAEGELVGGLYGVSLGRAFFGESMFSRERDASKVALVHLAERCGQENFAFIDCQVYTQHLHSLGATEIPRPVFLDELEQALQEEAITDWPQAPQETTDLDAAG